MDKPGLADLMIAPLILLERTKGWKLRGLAFLYLMIALTVGALGWRALCLWRLPNAPEPFDLVKYGRVEVLDADNAMVAYREIFAKFGDLNARDYKVASEKAWAETDWPVADPEARRWADDHRDALEAWLPANDRPDSLFIQPEEVRINTSFDQVRTLVPYARLALFEGSRLEQLGDLAGAWRMYRAALRASRHAARHGSFAQRVTGMILNQTRKRIDPWIEQPGITAQLLRRALDDVEACRAMTSPASEMVRAEYFWSRNAIGDMDRWRQLSETGPYSGLHWYNQFAAGRWAYRFLRREPERSARVLRLVTAGYLSQCDRPSSTRPKLLHQWLMIYDHDARTPPSVRAISPDALESWGRDSIVYELGPFQPQIQGILDSELRTFDRFTLKMAERAFEIERGRPPKTHGELIGSYLKALPAGVEPSDLVNP
ncbi:hypothetical protein P12x_005850 [Tundrisphaera lichenicola]|uniref:hypothetical protein n=1 Tax=Tundrisphaera lichenicola TaxID=2029860 RepID=UPI003EC0230D